jgi:glutamate N-acetyltransferase/amino-acid N-acetyltransferase
VAERGRAYGSEAVADVVETAKKAMKPVSPLAPASFPHLPVIAGRRIRRRRAGIKYPTART